MATLVARIYHTPAWIVRFTLNDKNITFLSLFIVGKPSNPLYSVTKLGSIIERFRKYT